MNTIKIISFVTFVALFNFYSMAQYLGPLNQEIYSSFTKMERTLFDQCVKDSGVPLDSMIWIQIGDSVYNEVRLDDGYTYHYSKRTIIHNSNGEHWVLEDKGNHQLDKPHFLVAVFHYSTGITRVTLMMYE